MLGCRVAPIEVSDAMKESRVIYVHFNRRSAKVGKPWTVHSNGKCIPVSYIRIERPVETVWKPEARSNPRGLLRVIGRVRFDRDSAIIF